MIKKEEDVPAGSCQHTVRPLSREYASVTQKLCRDEHKGGEGYLHSRTSVLCISVLSADKQACMGKAEVGGDKWILISSSSYLKLFFQLC